MIDDLIHYTLEPIPPAITELINENSKLKKESFHLLCVCAGIVIISIIIINNYSINAKGSDENKNFNIKKITFNN